MGLAVTFMVLTFGITIDSAFAQTSITINPIGSIDDGDGATLELDGAAGITSFKIGTSTYVAVASAVDDGVQILDVTTPSNISAVSQITDDTTLELDDAFGITSFKIGTSTYVAVASSIDDGVQILDVTTPSNISAVSQITDDAALKLDSARGITSFKIGTLTYVAVASSAENAVQILDVTTPGTITPVSQITNNATLELEGARGITSFKIGTSTYVAVASSDDDGVQILDVTTPSNISAVSQITDDTTLELDGAYGITSFKIGTSTYVSVSAFHDDGVQILDVTTPSNISAVSQITDDTTLELDGAYGITSFKIGTSTYVSVSSLLDSGIQILDVTTPSNITPIYQITDDATLLLNYAIGITSFKIGTSTYVAVAALYDDGVQMFELIPPAPNQPPTANAGRDRTFALGSTVTLSGSGTDPDGNDSNLTYTWEQNPTDTVTVELTDENSARTTFTAPSDPTELVFTLTVSDSTDSTTDFITITIKEQPTQIRNIKEVSDVLVSAKITAPNEITMVYNEELSTFINSYLNFTISGEDMARNITGIDGSPSKRGIISIDGEDVNAYLTILTFGGDPVPAGSTGTMYMQHAEYYLKLIHVSDGQN